MKDKQNTFNNKYFYSVVLFYWSKVSKYFFHHCHYLRRVHVLNGLFKRVSFLSVVRERGISEEKRATIIELNVQ